MICFLLDKLPGLDRASSTTANYETKLISAISLAAMYGRDGITLLLFITFLKFT